MKRTLSLSVAAAMLVGLAATAGAQLPYYYTTKVTPGLSLSAKPKRDKKAPFKYRASGTVKRNGAPSSACTGTVRVKLKRGNKTVKSASTSVSSSCKYSKSLTAKRSKLKKSGKGRLKVTARFGGNSALRAKSAKSKTVRYG